MFFINGSFVTEEEAKISILDIGLLRGFGVFDYLRTYRKKPFQLRDHLLRLQYSADLLGLTLPYSFTEIEQIVMKLLALSQLSEASIKILLTGGVSPDQFTPQQNGTFAILVYPLATCPDHYFAKGVDVITTRLSRSLPTCKSIHYVPGIVALKKARTDNPVEALYVNSSNTILEATTSNFFAVKDRVLYTRISDEVLAGITQEVVLKLAKGRFTICEEGVSYDEIGDLSEAFLTSSNKEVMPIARIDSCPIGQGVGPVTQELMHLFAEYTAQDTWPLLDIARYQPRDLLTLDLDCKCSAL